MPIVYSKYSVYHTRWQFIISYVTENVVKNQYIKPPNDDTTKFLPAAALIITKTHDRRYQMAGYLGFINRKFDCLLAQHYLLFCFAFHSPPPFWFLCLRKTHFQLNISFQSILNNRFRWTGSRK